MLNCKPVGLLFVLLFSNREVYVKKKIVFIVVELIVSDKTKKGKTKGNQRPKSESSRNKIDEAMRCISILSNGYSIPIPGHSIRSVESLNLLT